MSDRQVSKPTLCLDFDGVIHKYSKGWQSGHIYDTVMPGFFEWLVETHTVFKIVIYSSRSKDERMRAEMANWLNFQAGRWLEGGHATTTTAYLYAILRHIEYAHEKPAAYLTIDDRAMTFNGDWLDCQWEAANLMMFKPWNAPT